MYKAEIIAAFQKYTNGPFLDEKAFRVMAERYPDGKQSFWEKKRFDLIEKIRVESWILGNHWLNSNCPHLSQMNDFVSIIDQSLKNTLNSVYLSHLTTQDREKLKSKEIDLFFRFWGEYLAINKIIQDLEHEAQGPLTYERLFNDEKECTRITQIINEQACKDGVFVRFPDTPGTPTNQLKIVFETVSKQHFKPIYLNNGKGQIEAAKLKFFERFGWTGYRGQRPEKPNCLDVTKSITDKEDISTPNQAAIKDIQLILSQR